MLQDIIRTLSRLGLNRYDVQVYLCCLHHKGGLFVHEIVKETKIKRSTVYLAIKRLMEEGYATQIKVGSRFKYYAEDPETLVIKHEKNLEDLKELAPLLSRLGAQPSESEVRFFEGAEGIKQIHRNALIEFKFCEDPNKRVHLGFASGDNISKVFPDFQRAYVDKRVRLNVPYKAIIPLDTKDDPLWTNDPKFLREIKHFNHEEFPFKIMFEVFVDSVMFFSPRKPISGVLIKNERIADSIRNLHRLVWSLLPN